MLLEGFKLTESGESIGEYKLKIREYVLNKMDERTKYNDMREFILVQIWFSVEEALNKRGVWQKSKHENMNRYKKSYPK